MYFGQVVTAYGSSLRFRSNIEYLKAYTSLGYAYFAPTIIQSYGYGSK